MEESPVIVFLVGPPGSGKSTLGAKACTELGLSFLDLHYQANLEATLQDAIATREADVIALPWAPDLDKSWLRLCRKSGATVAMWAHPLDMQTRSGRTESLFTPVPRLRTKGGFGRNGTGCREFRHLERTCEHQLLLVGLTQDQSWQEVRKMIHYLREQSVLSPAVKEGMAGWARSWVSDYDADPKACKILLDAMGSFTLHLKKQGASPRVTRGVYGDLNAAGLVVMRECCPKAIDVLEHFTGSSPEHRYARLFSDSQSAVDRFTATWNAFAEFLEEAGS